jgi:hypothetical protein
MGHPDIVKAYSIPDLIVRVLAIEYLGRRDLGNSRHILNGSAKHVVEKTVMHPTTDTMPALSPQQIRQMGYEGVLCQGCGSHRVKRDAKCLKCDDCGKGEGCN